MDLKPTPTLSALGPEDEVADVPIDDVGLIGRLEVGEGGGGSSVGTECFNGDPRKEAEADDRVRALTGEVEELARGASSSKSGASACWSALMRRLLSSEVRLLSPSISSSSISCSLEERYMPMGDSILVREIELNAAEVEAWLSLVGDSWLPYRDDGGSLNAPLLRWLP